ncbi:hypothetical protein BCU25_016435 [Vibrio cyclitrophicus]|nr:hypothetical protein [Vibrio cyclitrophicus]PMJ34128.1 hypothetical protein BCU25_09395 [Vibrio cyclitrophicus]
MINGILNYHGVDINVDVRVSALQYQYYSPKEWSFVVEVKNDGKSVPYSKSYSFIYEENQDPLKKAYEVVKLSGDFTEIIDM